MILDTTSWDLEFFKMFISISHQYYGNSPDYVKETLEDYQKMLDTNAPFNLRNNWKAWIVIEDNQIKGRVFANTRNDEYKQMNFLPFGYFEAESQSVANQLFDQVKKFAKELNYTSIRGPIQGNVFNSSRFLTFQTRSLFLGEPLHKVEYVKYFYKAGFKSNQTWISASFDFKGRLIGMYDYLRKLKKSPYRKKNYKIRNLKIERWDEEMKLFYELMMDSFSELNDVECISFEEFKVWNESLKSLLNPSDCLILEHEGEALGFLLAIRDRRKELAAFSRRPNLLYKLNFLLRHKMKQGTLLVNYLGKRRGAEGKVKGVSIKLFQKLSKNYHGFLLTPTIFGFISEHSRVLELVPKVYQVSSKYCMFEQDLTS